MWYDLVPADSVVHWSERADAGAAIFGHASYLTQAPQPVVGDVVSTHWQWAVVVVALLCFYCYLLFRHRTEIRVSVKAAFSLDDTLFIFENLTGDFARFLRLARLLLVFSVAVLLCSFVHVDAVEQLWVVAAGAVGVWICLIVSSLVRRMVAAFDYVPSRWEAIGSITRLDHAIVALAFCPVTLLLVAAHNYALVAVSLLIVLWCYHVVRLLRFFKLTGFSSLQWFLYLCAIEALPFSLILCGIKWVGMLN